MVTERRQTLRAKPYEPIYVGLAKQNRGIVIDASENGLQFLADSPIEQDQSALALRFILTSFNQIETTGEVIWTDESKRAGGVRFKDLADSSRLNIRKWLDENAQPLPALAAAAMEQTAAGAGSSAEPIDAQPLTARADEAGAPPVLPPGARDDYRAGVSARSSEFSVPWRSAVASRPAEPEGRSRRAAVGNAVIILGLVFAALASIGLLVYQWQTGKGIQALGQDLASWYTGNSESASENSNADSISPLLRPPTEAHRRRPIIAGQNADVPLTYGPGDAELANALQHLRGDGGPGEASVAAKWLWASVKKGNPNAAMVLADLYVWGQGVPQNCEQARVLLIAAAKHGSAEASQKLQDMDMDGCGSAPTASK